MTTVSFHVYSESPSRRGRRIHTIEEVLMDNENNTVGGYDVPVDPMDMLQCDSCQ
jgi:hypothetical protein